MQHSPLLTDASITRTLLQFSVPILGMNVLHCLSGSVTAFWVGRYLGEAALTAVANAQSMTALVVGAAFGVTMAATVLVGQRLGAGNITDAKRVVTTGSIVFLVLSMAMSIAGSVFAEPALLALKTADAALPLAISCTTVMFLGLPINCMYMFVVSLLLGAGEARLPLWSIVLSATIGAVLSPVLMFGGVFVPGAGVAGAALASVIAQAVSLVTLIYYLYRRRHPLCIYREDRAALRIDWSVVSTLFRKGLPMGVQYLVVSLSAVLMIAIVNRFGVETTAAYGASIQLWTYIQLPALAISVAASSMTAQSVGAQSWDRVGQIARVGILCCLLITGSIVLLIYATDGHVYRLFLPDDSPAIRIASHLNGIAMWSFVFLTVTLLLFGVMRATGAVMAPLVIHSLSLLGVRFPMAGMLIDRWQEDAIWWSFPVSIAVDVLLALLYYKYGDWRGVGRFTTLPPAPPVLEEAVASTDLAREVSTAQERP